MEQTPRRRRGAGGSSSLRAWLRQLRYPSVFRIAAPGWPAGLYEALDRVERLQESARVASPLAERTPAPEETVPGTPGGTDEEALQDPGVDDAALVDAAMGLWRAGRRLDRAEDGEAKSLARQVGKPMARAWDGLQQLGIEVRDHEGEPYESGLTLTAVAFEPKPGLTRETIVETVQPTIIRTGRRIQEGEVVVGRPEGSQES